MLSYVEYDSFDETPKLIEPPPSEESLLILFEKAKADLENLKKLFAINRKNRSIAGKNKTDAASQEHIISCLLHECESLKIEKDKQSSLIIKFGVAFARKGIEDLKKQIDFQYKQLMENNKIEICYELIHLQDRLIDKYNFLIAEKLISDPSHIKKKYNKILKISKKIFQLFTDIEVLLLMGKEPTSEKEESFKKELSIYKEKIREAQKRLEEYLSDKKSSKKASFSSKLAHKDFSLFTQPRASRLVSSAEIKITMPSQTVSINPSSLFCTKSPSIQETEKHTHARANSL